MEGTIALLIPIVAIVMAMSIPIVAIILKHRKQQAMFALYHQERMAAIEKGVELPPVPDAFFYEDGPKRPASPHRRLLAGLVWLFVGLAVTGALFFSGHRPNAWFGLIPTGIGAAYLIYYFVVGKREAELEMEARRKTAEPPVVG
jgi:hypothetical protein